VPLVRELAITAVGSDRPGIVAGMTDALLGLGANLLDCRAALLRGSFAIVMAIELPDEISDDQVNAAIAAPADALGLRVWVGDTHGDDHPHDAQPVRCIVSVYGADHPGIVSAVTRALAERHVNIVDLSSRSIGSPPVYVLGIEAELPLGMSVAALSSALQPVASAQDINVSVEATDDEVI
jgi:glycine cleavage system transcriptional repressor